MALRCDVGLSSGGMWRSRDDHPIARQVEFIRVRRQCAGRNTGYEDDGRADDDNDAL